MPRQFTGHKTIRLRDFDYGSHRSYFITIVTSERKCNLSRIVDGAVQLSKFGKAAEAQWQLMLGMRPFVCSRQFLIMPNHIHALINVIGPETDSVPSKDNFHRYQRVRPNTVSTVIGGFKSAVSREVNKLRNTPGARFWQDGFYDHVIRSEEDLFEVSEYIAANPERWHFDRENEEAQPDATEQAFWRQRLNLRF